jgi:hypothetical protein
VNVIRHEMPLLDLGLLLDRKPMKDLAQMPAKFLVQSRIGTPIWLCH